MKKLISILLLFCLTLGCCACTSGANSGSRKLSIVTTIFPVYDWVNQIVGEGNADITMLLDNGVDLHSYQPTADDMVAISKCDLFIYVGGESDGWVESTLQSVGGNVTTLNLMEALGSRAVVEEELEGMQVEDEEEEEAYDEHIWLSLKNASFLCQSICDKLCTIGSADAEAYKTNAAAYIEKLNTLDASYENTIANASVKTLLFADRFPFRYLADDYGLTCYAAFSGCSAESEASFETIQFLASKVDELGLTAVIHLEGSDGKIAETVVGATVAKNQAILTLDSLQSVTAEKLKAGASYLASMENNLTVLTQALQPEA